MSHVFLCAPLCDAPPRTAITKITNRHNNIELVGIRPVYPCMTPPNNADETPVAVLEARMDGRISSMEATFSSFVKLMDERQKVSDARFDRIEAMLTEMRANIASLRTTIVVTGISSVLAAVLGISAFNAALYSNMLAAMSAGKEMAQTQAEMKRIVEEAAILVKQAKEEKSQPKQPPSD
jgi:hypothetical protein